MRNLEFSSHPAAEHLGFAEESAVDAWRDAVRGMYPGLSIDWLDNRPRRAWLKTGAFADAQVIEMANAPMHVVGPRAAGHDSYRLVLQLAGNGRRLDAGHEAFLGPGDLMLVNGALPFDVTHPAPWRLLIWHLPREVLAPMLAAPDREIPHRIAAGDGLTRVLGAYACALIAEADRIDPSAQRGLLMHLCGLVALAVGPGPIVRESRRETYRAVRRRQILTYVEAHLPDHRLTAQRVAYELQMSPRWLHALCGDGGVSFAGWVARRRLEECRTLLDDPAHDRLSVAEIAFRWGFNDLSTFNRRFRALYGMTPRDARRARAMPG